MTTAREGGHDTTAYERPTHPFVCGRAAMWRATCWQGPTAAGACGGACECAPVLIGERWECRRPRQAGGRCKEGPLPNGECALRHAPCLPKPTLRRSRGRFSVLALLALGVLFIIGPDPMSPSLVNPAALDSGNLSSVHAGFTRDQGCGACHASHDAAGLGWIPALFRSNDPSAKCLDCHSFAGKPMEAHNVAHPKRTDLGELSCARCHTEHRGESHALAKVPDQVCANCHERSFSNFAAAHPEFPARFPYERPGAIHFNHTKHLKGYFADAKHAKRSPKFAAAARTRCTVCHEVEAATRQVRPKPYAEICAGCHEPQIQKAELNLLEAERLTPAASVLLGLARDGDEAEAGARLKKLFQEMARSGTEALGSLAAADAGGKPAAALFDGLSSQAVQAVGAAWAAGKPLPPGEGEDARGWVAGDNADGAQALFYRPRGHADPVLRAWNQHVRAGALGKVELQGQIAADALDHFLDSEAGPGACGKCHAASLRSSRAETLDTAWRYAGSAPRPFVRYSHAPHLGLLDPDSGCTACHALDSPARYAKYHAAAQPSAAAYHSNFAAIRKETCVACHRTGHVAAACQVCHEYHSEHRLNLGFRQKGLKGEDR